MTTPASAIPTEIRRTSWLMRVNSTAAPTHDANALNVSRNGSLNSSRRWRSVGGRPCRTQTTARRSTTAFSGIAIATMASR